MTQINCVWDAKAELGEGVFWHAAESAVYWVDIFQSKLYRLSRDGEQRSWHFPGQLSSVMPCQGGGLLATFEFGLAHIDLATEQVTPLLQLESEKPHNRFNDGCTDILGQFWFGSMDQRQTEKSGRFYRQDREGKVHCLASFGDMCITNGPAFSADGRWVFFTDTIEGKIFRAELSQLGEPSEQQLFIDFAELEGHPDGMCTDTAGGLWVCHYAGARITRFDESGALDQVLKMPVPNITKCAFGGENLQTLYITTAWAGLDQTQIEEYPLSGGLFAIELPYRGFETSAAARTATQQGKLET